VIISLVMLALSAGYSLARPIQAAELDKLRWLAGCWEMRQGDRITEEQWMTPRGGVMVGMSRTVRGEALVELEQVRIETRGTGMFYVASPLRQATAEFKAAAVSADSITFENPAHDFPSKISYRKLGADSLVASIAGQRGGSTRRIEYPYRRVACVSVAP
jgi:hypothetical protein